MTVQEFIDKIAENAVKNCNASNLLPSPTLAQAIIESRYGTSALAVQANNLFGIIADSRWSGKYVPMKTKEYKNGQYIDIVRNFRSYSSWDKSIVDHNNFLGAKRYANLKGVRDYKEYCKLIHQDGYATAPDYAQTLINCIEKYNLQQYDIVEEVKEPIEDTVVEAVNTPRMNFNIHAGHNPSGMIASGSVGYLNESDENRSVCEKLVGYLSDMGHTVYDCTCNDGTSQKDVLQKIVAKCNAHNVDLDVSIHFNAVTKEFVKDDKTKGVEVWLYEGSRGDTELVARAQSVCDAVAKLGYTNRGVKFSSSLYFLKNTKAKAMLIECCFVDDIDDFEIYDCDKMSKAIVYGLTDEVAGEVKVEHKRDDVYYTVVLGYYANETGALALKKILEDYGYLLNTETDELRKGIITSIREIPKEVFDKK